MSSPRLTSLTSARMYSLLSASLLAAIGRLIRLDTVRSVSCPFRDPAVWRLLVDEQLRRAEAAGLHPQLAFGLTGPEVGLQHIPLADWGGCVHTPYEGAAPADLFITPAWRMTYAEYGGVEGSLSAVVHGLESPAIGYYCHHLVTQVDLGELGCATREELGDGWIAYASTRPYVEAVRRWTKWALRDGAAAAPWPF